MCGPSCWWCPVCSGGESQNSDYVRIDGNHTSYEYRWSCRQYFCCIIQLAILAVIGLAVYFGSMGIIYDPNNSNSTLIDINSTNWIMFNDTINITQQQ